MVLATLPLGMASAQAPKKAAGTSGAGTKPAAAQPAAAHRANELTMAGLRPGRDTVKRALALYQKYLDAKASGEQTVLVDECRNQTLTIDVDAGKKIQVLRVDGIVPPKDVCEKPAPGPWKTGLGLRVGDRAAKVSQLYGEPDSKSPSSRAGRQLELWYYAFEWAGPDVPQVMEVLCTRGKEGEPAEVVEITLAAPSL